MEWVVLIALAIWLVVRFSQAKHRVGQLSFQVDALKSEIAELRREREAASPVKSTPPEPIIVPHSAIAPIVPRTAAPPPPPPPVPAATHL